MRRVVWAGIAALLFATAPAVAREHCGASSRIAAIVAAAARRHGVPEALALGVARVESGMNPRARNRSGASGVMQIMPRTAHGLGCHGSLFDPVVNADCGARYLARLLRISGGDQRRAAGMYLTGEGGSVRSGARYAERVMAGAGR